MVEAVNTENEFPEFGREKCVVCSKKATPPFEAVILSGLCYHNECFLIKFGEADEDSDDGSRTPKRKNSTPTSRRSAINSPRSPRSPRTSGHGSFGTPTQNRCRECGDLAYAMDTLPTPIGQQKDIYHIKCFKCHHCKVRLNLKTHQMKDSRVYCNKCYAKYAMKEGSKSSPASPLKSSKRVNRKLRKAVTQPNMVLDMNGDDSTARSPTARSPRNATKRKHHHQSIQSSTSNQLLILNAQFETLRAELQKTKDMNAKLEKRLSGLELQHKRDTSNFVTKLAEIQKMCVCGAHAQLKEQERDKPRIRGRHRALSSPLDVNFDVNDPRAPSSSRQEFVQPFAPAFSNKSDRPEKEPYMRRSPLLKPQKPQTLKSPPSNALSPPRSNGRSSNNTPKGRPPNPSRRRERLIRAVTEPSFVHEERAQKGKSQEVRFRRMESSDGRNSSESPPAAATRVLSDPTQILQSPISKLRSPPRGKAEKKNSPPPIKLPQPMPPRSPSPTRDEDVKSDEFPPFPVFNSRATTPLNSRPTSPHTSHPSHPLSPKEVEEYRNEPSATLPPFRILHSPLDFQKSNLTAIKMKKRTKKTQRFVDDTEKKSEKDTPDEEHEVKLLDEVIRKRRKENLLQRRRSRTLPRYRVDKSSRTGFSSNARRTFVPDLSGILEPTNSIASPFTRLPSRVAETMRSIKNAKPRGRQRGVSDGDRRHTNKPTRSKSETVSSKNPREKNVFQKKDDNA